MLILKTFSPTPPHCAPGCGGGRISGPERGSQGQEEEPRQQTASLHVPGTDIQLVSTF